MQLTKKQLAVLNHVVIDGQLWADNATEEHMLAKVDKYEVSYLSEKDKPDYKTRKQRDDAEVQAEQDARENAPWHIKRKREYPSILELVVALYATDDKAAIEKRRADVKAKYPKP